VFLSGIKGKNQKVLGNTDGRVDWGKVRNEGQKRKGGQ